MFRVLSNNLTELTILLDSDLISLDMLCFTEHWLTENPMTVLNTDHFKLVILVDLAVIMVYHVFLYERIGKL
jgi:hypothetical protein